MQNSLCTLYGCRMGYLQGCTLVPSFFHIGPYLLQVALACKRTSTAISRVVSTTADPFSFACLRRPSILASTPLPSTFPLTLRPSPPPPPTTVSVSVFRAAGLISRVGWEWVCGGSGVWRLCQSIGLARRVDVHPHVVDVSFARRRRPQPRWRTTTTPPSNRPTRVRP